MHLICENLRYISHASFVGSTCTWAWWADIQTVLAISAGALGIADAASHG